MNIHDPGYDRQNMPRCWAAVLKSIAEWPQTQSVEMEVMGCEDGPLGRSLFLKIDGRFFSFDISHEDQPNVDQTIRAIMTEMIRPVILRELDALPVSSLNPPRPKPNPTLKLLIHPGTRHYRGYPET